MTQTTFNFHYEKNKVALENFAKKLTKNPVDAKDLMQETILKAYKSMHTFKPGTSFKSWSFTILKNTFITKYNRRKKKGVINSPIEDLSYMMKSNYSVRNDAVSKLQIKDIKGCIKALSEKAKTPFLMHIEGYQYNEIADSLEIPIGTVKSRINFARTKLKSMMNNRGIIKAA